MRRHDWLVAAGLALLAGGCMQSDVSRYYLLAPIAAANPAAGPAFAAAVAVGPVEVPKHVDRSEIVSFTSANQLDLAEFDRWAEPLSEGMARTIVENLSVMLPSDRVLIYAGRRTAPFRYQVAVDVHRFEITPAGAATLTASWSVQTDDGREAVAARRSVLRQDAGSPAIEAKVAAMSRAVAELSREIAAALRALPSR